MVRVGLLGTIVAVLLVGCRDEQQVVPVATAPPSTETPGTIQTPTQTPAHTPTATPTPVPLPVEPCVQSSDICDERDVSGFDPFGGAAAGLGGGAAYGYEPQDAPTVEEILEKGLYQSGASPVHIAFRGAPLRDSIRCDWRGRRENGAAARGVGAFLVRTC